MNFDMDSSDFEAEFTANFDINAPTVVYVNQPYYYPDGYNYTISASEDQIRVDVTDSRYLKVWVTDEDLHGETVKINIMKN